MTKQKEIANALDSAAARAEMVGAYGASSKQCWFLAKLLKDHGLDEEFVECGVCNTQAMLSKKKASRFIDEALSGKWKAMQAA